MQFDEMMGGVKVMNTIGRARSIVWVEEMKVRHK